MEIIRRAELEELAGVQNGPCVTAYLPVHSAYPETKGDSILFRNLIDRAEQQLVDQQTRSPDVREFLKPVRELQESDEFWRSSGASGLAVFLARNFFRHHRLPYTVPESVDVAASFYLTPLAHSLVEDVRFHLLALSPNRLQLFRGDSRGMTPVEMPDNVPRSQGDAAAGVETEYETSVQYHTSSGFGKTGSLKGTAHGHGDPRDDRHEVFIDFLHTVARELDPLLKKENLPLFLAAVEEDHPVFHNVCHYPLLQQDGVIGSPTELSEQEIFARVLPLARSWAQRNLNEHRRLYDRQRDTEQASDDLATIVAGAAQGRVNALFAGLRERRWGVFDSNTGRAAEHFEQQSGDVDLIDLAVRLSLTHGSEVFVVPQGEVPDGKPAIATLRW